MKVTNMELNLKTKCIGRPFLWLDEIDSTNEELKRMAAADAVHGTVLLADYQTGGKGRRGRTWDSPKGDNIYLSILLRPELKPSEASMLTLIGALAVADSIEETTGSSCQIKWPNDLVLDSKKVCGILTEMSTGVDGIHYIIVGIGINVNRSIFPEEIAHMASSIDKGQGRDAIVASLLFRFEEKYNLFLEHKNLAPFLDEYNGRLAGIGRQVQILSGGEGVVRTSHGIDEEGALIVSDEEGNEEKIISGEVSVRGLYGYV